MDKSDVLRILCRQAIKQFPKKCLVCGRKYNSLKKYLQLTSHIGNPHIFDTEQENFELNEPLGGVWFSACMCGNTLAITSGGVSSDTAEKILRWARGESFVSGISVDEFFGSLIIDA